MAEQTSESLHPSLEIAKIMVAILVYLIAVIGVAALLML